MIRILLAILCGVVIALTTGCGGGGGGGSAPSIFDDSSCANSPNGSIAPGTRVFSPDGKWYAELATISGQIVIFDAKTGVRSSIIKALPVGEVNDLKGMAWSRDSLHMAVLFHGGTRPGIRIYTVETGEFVRQIGPEGTETGWYHWMVFSNDNTEVIASVDKKNQLKYSSGLPVLP